MVVRPLRLPGGAARWATGASALADNWLRHIQDVRQQAPSGADGMADEQQEDVLCEMNVIERVGNVCNPP